VELINNSGNIRSEDDLLLCCSRTHVDPVRRERIEAILKNEIEWPYLIRTAIGHGLIPLLYKNLKETYPDAVPKGIINQIRNYFLLNASRNLLLNEELFKLLHLFETEGIPTIPYKGPTLAASAYGDVTLRQFFDLDILIQKEDLKKARDLIIALGYRPHIDLSDVNLPHYVKSRNELSFLRRDGRVPVELQWEITPHYLNYPIPSKYLWRSTERFSSKNSEFHTLPADVELLVICVHGAKDLWARLLWVCDVAELIRKNDGLDWNRVVSFSSTSGSLRMLFLGLVLARDLLDVSIPEEVTKKADADPMVRRLAQKVEKGVFKSSNGSYGTLKKLLFYFKTRERLKDRIQYCLRLATAITPEDRTFFSLPKFLFPVYYLIRPIRLMKKYGSKLLRSS
jgi:hypothetical protein